MFTVKECTAQENACHACDSTGGAHCPLSERLGGNAQEGDRIFVLTEGEPKAVGVLGLKKGKVVVKGVFGDIDASYRDLMVRSLLHVCRCMNPITVRVESEDAYYKQFGFAAKDGGMEVHNGDIQFH